MFDSRIIPALIAASVVVAATVALFQEDGGGMTGVASESRKTENGYVFEIVISNGETVKCFTGGSPPESGKTVTVYGSFSKDGRIFFTEKVVCH